MVLQTMVLQTLGPKTSRRSKRQGAGSKPYGAQNVGPLV
jgi:hypothetical protein